MSVDIELLSEQLLSSALEKKASDIHFIPQHADVLVEMRVNNSLVEFKHYAASLAERMISYFKFLASMDIGEKRRPQNGAMEMTVNQQLVHMRLSTLPTAFSESLVIRLLPHSDEMTLSDLTIFKDSIYQLESLLNYQNGLILISGPTGSGKTTTLYTMLMTAKRRFHSRIVTLEDPVEKKNEGFIQMEVNEKALISYSEGFKAILRHDPDIIMVGEIRDYETAQIAVRAALTGHLILSTVHAFDAYGTIQRILELGISLYDLRETLVGVVSERLVTQACPICGQTGQSNCPHPVENNRTGIFEILAGMPLHEILSDGKRNPRSRYKKFDDYLQQGILSGALLTSQMNEGNNHA